MPDTLQISKTKHGDTLRKLLLGGVEGSSTTPSIPPATPQGDSLVITQTTVSINNQPNDVDSIVANQSILEICRISDLESYKNKTLEMQFASQDTLYTIQPFQASSEQVYGVYSTVPLVHSGKDVLVDLPLHAKPFWLDGLALSICLAMIILLFYTKGFVVNVFKMMVDYRMSSKHFEEDSTIESRYRFYFVIFFTVVLPVFMYGSCSYLFPAWQLDYLHLLIIYLVFSGKWLLESAFFRLASIVTMSEHLTGELYFSRQLAYGATGILLFPIAIALLLYDNYEVLNTLVWVGIGLFACLFLFILIRSAMIFREARISIFFWFLYLCVFEISPYLVLYVVFQSNM